MVVLDESVTAAPKEYASASTEPLPETTEPTSASGKAAVQFYGDEAMKLLRDAVAKGFKDAARMKKDCALDVI
jgi:hypothetical protein